VTLEQWIAGLTGPYGVIILGVLLAVAFYWRWVVPGTWWRTERSARIRAEQRVQRLLLVVGKVTGANEVFLEALRETTPEQETSERS